LAQFARLDDLATRTTVDLQDRQLVEAFVQRIEINPDAKTGEIILIADLADAFREGSTREPIGDFMGNHEWCFYGWREGAAHVYLGPNNATDVWSVKKVNPQSMVHLTEKPVELAVRAMQYSSRAGEHVLDLFGGSGSTLMAAEQTGRKAFLMELDPLYCDVIVQRYEKFSGQKAERVPAQEAAA
jgi:DNA modification methylase